MEKGVTEEERATGGGSTAAHGGGSGGAIRWERFLPRRSLRVLLVEHDDCTRQVVTALLRKCSYHVAAVADGLKAWEVLKEKRYGFDLVLCEVAMPLLSGIGLLSKIMSTEECKNIPVIMMSSHDSVNVVLKCMLKGAVDFLVKPVRKNELRNLWQHVWRRHSSSSYVNASDNNTASNQICAHADDRSNTGENSDAQSSGSKPDVDIESTQKNTESPLAENETVTREGEANLEQPDNDISIFKNTSEMDNDGEPRSYKLAGIEKGITLSSPGDKRSAEQNCSYDISPYREENLELMRSTEGDHDNPKSNCQNKSPNDSVQNMIIFGEPVSNEQCSYTVLNKDALAEDGLHKAEGSHEKDASVGINSPSWELSLRRPQANGCVQPEFKEKHVLRQSSASAFSRYGDKRIHSSCHSTVHIGTGEHVDKCRSHVGIHGTDDEEDIPLCSSENRLLSPQRNEDEATVVFQVSSNAKENAGLSCPHREDANAGHSGTMEDPVLCHPHFGFIPLPIPVGPVPYQSLCAAYGAIMQPVFYPETLTAQSSGATDRPAFHSNQSAHHNSHLKHYSLPVHHEETQQLCHWKRAIDGDPRELSCNPMEQAYQSGSCSQDVVKGHGSNGSGEAADGAGYAGTALESGNESGVQNCNYKGLDCDRSRREAALIKFRMKRKDRCFEKKVRYYNRKKLAEQRPRIKGQFVRQKIPDSMTTPEADS